MTISLPGSSKRGLAGLFARKGAKNAAKVEAQKPLAAHEVAKLFAKSGRNEEAAAKPTSLSEKEKRERDRLTNLRGALYSKD